MKIVTSIMFLLIPVVAAAQGMSEADLQNMMQQMQKMQACMEDVDQGALEALDKRSSELEAELQSLCEQGKRDKAQEKAIAYGKEIMDNSAIKQMKKCSELTKGLVPQREMPSSKFDFDFSNRHVCDE